MPVNEFSRAKIDASVAELKEEKSLVGELLAEGKRSGCAYVLAELRGRAPVSPP